VKKIIDLLKKVTLRDVLLVCGLGLLAHGLYLLYPWLSFTVCGILILVGGIFMGEK